MRAAFSLLLALAAGAALAQAPPTGRIVYARQEGKSYKLHVILPSGEGDRRLATQPEGDNLMPAWSSDGTKIVFTNTTSRVDGASEVCTIRADGREFTRVEAPSAQASAGVWGPDGQQLALVAMNTVASQNGVQRINGVFLVDTKTPKARKLNGGTSGAYSPFWFPGGERIGYVRYGGAQADGTQVVAVRPDGAGEEVLLKGPHAYLVGPRAVSPDGKSLLFVAAAPTGGAEAALQALDLNTRQVREIAKIPLRAKGAPDDAEGVLPVPAWSPDGRWILVPMATGRGNALFRVSSDGKQQVRITPEGIDCQGGDWTAVGSRQ